MQPSKTLLIKLSGLARRRLALCVKSFGFLSGAAVGTAGLFVETRPDPIALQVRDQDMSQHGPPLRETGLTGWEANRWTPHYQRCQLGCMDYPG